MTKRRHFIYKSLFFTAAIYDLALGIIFTFFYETAFEILNAEEWLPEFGGYIALIGSFLFVIGVAYALIYRGDLEKNRDLILVGTLYKLAYFSIAFVYYAVGPIPHILFVSLFGVADLIFFILMLECYIYIGKHSSVN